MYNIQDNTRSFPVQYLTPDNTQTATNTSHSQPRSLQNSQSNTSQLVDSSFLSDVPQSEYSIIDNPSTISTLQELSDLAPHTPESLLCSPASPGDERTDLNSRKREQPPTLRRSPRISNQTPEQLSDSTSLKSQDSLNNREPINKNPAALALEVLDESILLEREISRSSDSPRMEQEFSTSLIDTESRDVTELRDLITTSNMILESVHNISLYKDQEGDDEMKDIEYTIEPQQQKETNEQPHEVFQSELEREHENENEYSESVDDLFIANEVEPESEEEIEQSTIPAGIRRSTRKRTTANYNYPRYGGGSKRSKTRKRGRSFRKRSLSATENEADVDSEVVNVENERNEETDEPAHELSPVLSDDEKEHETNEDYHIIHDSENVDKIIPDDESQSNLYLKHDLRSRKIMLELPELPKGVVEHEEIEEEPAVTAPFTKETTRSKQPTKKPILKAASKISAKTIPKRKTSRKLTSRRKIENREWRPDEADNESGDDVETTLRSRRATSQLASTPKIMTAKKNTKKRSSSRKTTQKSTDTTPEVSIRKRKAISKNLDKTPEVSTAKKSIKKSTPKTSKPIKVTRRGRPAKSTRGRKIRGGGRISRSKNHDAEYKYSGEEETESEVEITDQASEVNNNSENRILRSDAEIEDEIEPSTRPRRTRKSITKSSIIEPVSTPTRPTRSTTKSNKKSVREDVNNKDVNEQVDDDVACSIHEPSDKEDADLQQADIIPATRPKKTTKSTKGKSRGDKVKGQSGRVGGNTVSDQPPDPNSDPDLVEISAGNPKALEKAVRALAGQNYDIVHSPQNIDLASTEETRAPIFVKPHGPTTRSMSLSSTPPSESPLIWSDDHWNYLKAFYEETKNEYIHSGKIVSKNEDLYKEVIKKFFDTDISYKAFGEEDLRNRIIALESTDIGRRSSIESSSSKGSVSRHNKATRTKRKRSESNATAISKDKEEDKYEKDGETEDKISKRPRVEEDTTSASGSGIVHDMDAPQTSQNSSLLSRIFGSWFSRSG